MKQEHIILNPEVKQAWIEALTSGEYERGRGYLRVNAKFCCLGVLCDLHSKDNKEFAWVKGLFNTFTYDECEGRLPTSVSEWVGVSEDDSSSFSSNLGWLNDRRGLTFRELAEYIEDNY